MKVVARITAASAVALLVLSATPAASADVLGGIDVVPEAGNSETLISVVTERGCAAPAERVSAVLIGAGLPPEGQVVVSPSEVLFSTTRPMELPLSNAFVVYAERNAAAFSGEYELTVRCTDRIGFEVIDEFTTTMIWKTPGNSLRNVSKATYTAKSTAGVVASDERGSTPSATESAEPKSDAEAAPAPTSTGEARDPASPSTGEKPLANDERPDGSNPSADGLAAATPTAAEQPTTQRTFWVLLTLTLALIVAVGLVARWRRSTNDHVLTTNSDSTL